MYASVCKFVLFLFSCFPAVVLVDTCPNPSNWSCSAWAQWYYGLWCCSTRPFCCFSFITCLWPFFAYASTLLLLVVTLFPHVASCYQVPRSCRFWSGSVGVCQKNIHACTQIWTIHPGCSHIWRNMIKYWSKMTKRRQNACRMFPGTFSQKEKSLRDTASSQRAWWRGVM